MRQIDLEKFIRAEIFNMRPYITVPSFWDLGEDFTKLDIGENPYGFSPKISKALGAYRYYNYYPDPEYKNLRKILAKYADVEIDSVMVGNGSDELLDLVLRVVINEGDKIINCPPTFGMYPVLINLNKGIEVLVLRKRDYSLDINSIKENIDESVKAIIICLPNNPTGTVTSEDEIITLLKTGKLVIVDEAYFEFYGKTVASLIKKYSNLIILRTLSKWAGMAGLRLGYVIASPFFIQQVFKIKQPYNVNLAAEVAGEVALSNLTQAKFIIQKIIKERERVYKQLQKISYLTVYPSNANFLFLKINGDLSKLRIYLEKEKIIVRYYDQAMRLTIGKPEQNNKVIKALEEVTL